MEIRQHTINTPYMVGPVHCYTTTIGEDLVLFDTGPPTAGARQYHGEHLDLQALRYVFLTHCHIDHFGLASWFERETDAKLFLPYRDGLKILEHQRRLNDIRALLERLGFSGEYLETAFKPLSDGSAFPEFPKKFSIVEDDMPPHLGIGFLNCPGHSQSDIVYFTDDWAITGDVLLRGVFQSPLLDVDLETGERFKNYQKYCTTLRNLATLRDKKIYPGHKTTIPGVDEVVVFYVSKMLRRAAQLGEVAGEENVAGIVTALFGDTIKDPFHIYLKVSEIVFMQDFLDHPELLRRSLEDIGLFRRVEEEYSLAVKPTGVES